jgi:hypothetical protein
MPYQWQKYGGKKWQTLKKCSSVRQLIVVVSMIRTGETEKAKLPKAPNLNKYLRIGNVRYAVPAKNVSGL